MVYEFKAPQGLSTSRKNGRWENGFSKPSKSAQRGGQDSILAYKKRLSESGIDLSRERDWEKRYISPTSTKARDDIASPIAAAEDISTLTAQPDDIAIDKAPLAKEKESVSPAFEPSDNDVAAPDMVLNDLTVPTARLDSVVFNKTLSAYSKDFSGLIPPEFLDLLPCQTATAPQIVNPVPMEASDATEGTVRDNDLRIEADLGSPTNRIDSHDETVNQRPLQLLPPRPPPPPSSGTLNSPSSPPSSIDTTVDSPLRPRIENYEPYGKIKRLRAEVRRLRLQAHEMRKLFREKQHARSTADDKYFQCVRKLKFRPYSDNDKFCADQELENLYHECERLRNEWGPLEDDYIALDDDLSYREFELEKLEDKMYERPVEQTAASLVPKIEAQKTTPASPPSYVLSELNHNYHPLVYQYLSKVGDVNNLYDRLDWHEDEKTRLEDEREARTRVNLPAAEQGEKWRINYSHLADEAEKWLQSYPKLKADLLRQIEIVEDEAEILKKQCLSRGLVDEDGQPTDFETRERQTFIHDIPFDSGYAGSEFVNFPTLLPQPSGQQEEFHDPGLAPNEPTVDPRDRINGWLLHQLRMSPLEVNRLATTYKLQYGEIDENENWELDVLELWYKDGAKEGNGRSGRTILSVSSGEVTEKSVNAAEKP